MTRNLAALAITAGVPLVGGQILGLLSIRDVFGWYNKLRKPKWCPPKFLFGPIWTVLYSAGGVASWMVWKEAAVAKRTLPLVLYGVQMVLNLAWTPIFFKAHRTDLALADAAAMLGVAAAATVSMSKAVSPEKILPLMGPYCAFVAFATALTYNIHRNNHQASDRTTTGPSDLDDIKDKVADAVKETKKKGKKMK